jgi:hypothetical protein
MTQEQKSQVKLENEVSISRKGYRINSWLPILESSTLRPTEQITGRMAVMNALLNIAFGAPVHIIKNWIETNGLISHLSSHETAILQKQNSQLTAQDTHSLEWYLEALWSFMWLTEMIDELAPEKYVGDNMASLLPNLQNGENNEKLEHLKSTRSTTEAYKMLDLYYRLHWYCVDERLNGRKAKLDEGVIYQRRKSLEWAFDSDADWDNVEMGT